MLPKKEHIKQIERFHNLIETIDKQIKELKGVDDLESTDPNDNLDIYMKYYTLSSKIWPLVDECIEEIKDKLDAFEDVYK